MQNSLRLSASPEQELHHELLRVAGVRLFVKRDDLLHDEVSGNKWRKLKYHIEEYFSGDYDGILTYGGAYSNHLAATAAACAELKIPCIAMIRGTYVDLNNITLSRCRNLGMQLKAIDIKAYDALARNIHPHPDFPKFLAIPEGGAGKLAIKGCTEILDELKEDYDMLICPLGTGTTFAGLLAGLSSGQTGIAVAAIKGANINLHVKQVLEEHAIQVSCQWEVLPEDQFGGFAKLNDELPKFKTWFETSFDIPLDYIYTAKMMSRIFERIRSGYFKKGTKILCLHTGGLQGNRSMEERYGL